MPDLAKTVTALFEDKVDFLAVNIGEPGEVVLDYIQDTGIDVPVLMDRAQDPSCWAIPNSDESLYEHYKERVGDPLSDPPFPLQVVIAPDGRFALLQRYHNVDALVDVLAELLSDPGP